MRFSVPLRIGKWLSSLSQNAMGYISMNQFFILLFNTAFKTFIPTGTVALIASKTVVFVAVMAAIFWITQTIMSSRFRIILGGK